MAECSIKKRGQNTDIVSFHNLIVKYLSFGIRVYMEERRRAEISQNVHRPVILYPTLNGKRVVSYFYSQGTRQARR